MKAKRRQELKTNDLAAALEDFVRAATCALLCVSVERYLRVKNFQRVSELRIRT